METNAVTVYQENQEDMALQFLDILLDETKIHGTIYVPIDCIGRVSAKNSRLPAKQAYEYVLRLAEHYPIRLSKTPPKNPADYILLENPGSCQNSGKDAEKELQADCYLAAKYKEVLRKHGLFDAAIESILSMAEQSQCRQQTISFLEEMLQGGEAYRYLDRGSRPFLIYSGSKECYQVLDSFAKSLGGALQKQGFLVEYFDQAAQTHMELSKYIGKSFQAIIGIQTYLFSARMKDGSFLHDQIKGPKYNFVFDHPLWMCRQFQNVPKSLAILTLDKDYVSYIRRHYPLQAYFLPPGGIQAAFSKQKRIYDVAFIGSYIDNSKAVFQKLRGQKRPMRFFINRYWRIMRKNPETSVEDALRQALSFYSGRLACPDSQFAELCYQAREYVLYLSQHYRRKLLKTLVHSGIRVDVFGTSWASCPLREHPNFIWHNRDLGTQECLRVWQQSKISLNIMSCHKNAITERIADSMMQKAAVCTERNPYLEGSFRDGEDILFYDLTHLSALPGRIAGLLKDEKKLGQIGENGCKKAEKQHTWDCRAKELVKIAQQEGLNKTERYADIV